jgi:hypothetical protein
LNLEQATTINTKISAKNEVSSDLLDLEAPHQSLVVNADDDRKGTTEATTSTDDDDDSCSDDDSESESRGEETLDGAALDAPPFLKWVANNFVAFWKLLL